MPRGKSLYHAHPNYRVDLKPAPERVQVRFAGRVIADSTRTLTVLETKHEPVTYFPREDVDATCLERTTHETFCPFKGEAAYWTLRVGDQVEENAVWTYEDPFEEVSGLKDYVSFYPDRVTWSRSAE